MERLIQRRFKDVTWYVPAGKEELLEGLEHFGKFPEQTAGVTVLKEGRRKSFIRLETFITGEEVYVKTFRLKGLLQRLKHRLLKSKALRELEVSLLAQERGIPVVLPLAAGEKRHGGLLQESYLLIQRLPGAIDLLKYLCMGNVEHRHEAGVIEALGRLCRKTHDRGILQEDFALNNFLLSNRQDDPAQLTFFAGRGDVRPSIRESRDGQVFLIDFERSHVRKELSTKEKEWTLAKLNRIGADFTLTNKFRFLKAYCNTKEEFRCLSRWKKLEKYTYQILKSDAQRISTACVRGGRGYKLYKDDKLTCYFREGYPLDVLLALALTGQVAQKEQRGQVNISRRRGWIKKEATEEAVLIYEFAAPKKGIPIATMAWRASNGLLKGYFPVDPPVAAIEWRTRNGGYRGLLLLKELEKAEDIRDVLHRCSQSAEGWPGHSQLAEYRISNGIPKMPLGATGWQGLQKRYSILWHTARFLSRLHNFGTFAYSIFPGDISLVKDSKWGHKLFLAQPYNFVIKKRLENGDREIDIQRLEDYLQGILTEEEKSYFREQYLRYSKIIS